MAKNTIYSTGLTSIRIGIFHIIGYFVGLSHTVSFTIATGVSFNTLLLEVLSRSSGKQKDLKHE